MRLALITLTIVAAAALALQVADVDAKRLGGGRSMGAQRQITPPSSSTSPTTPSGAASNPVMPAQPGTGIGRPATTAAASAGPRWLAPLAGLAAGLGIAALLSHFGLSESFAGLLLLVLLVVGAFAVLRLLMARKGAPTEPARYAAATSGGMRPMDPVAADDRVEPVLAPGPRGASMVRVPQNFAAAPFLEEAKRQFRALQSAYDRGDRSELARVMTPAMLAEVERDLRARGTHVATDVVMLDATLLDVDAEGDAYWASVRFSGMLREDGSLLPQSFEETWNLRKPIDGSSGWLLAGIEQRENIT